MTIYTIKNLETEEVFDIDVPAKDLDSYLEKHPQHRWLINPPNIVRHTSTMKTMRTDDGWKENLSRIAEAHPTSALGQNYKKKTAKEVKTLNIAKKHGIIK